MILLGIVGLKQRCEWPNQNATCTKGSGAERLVLPRLHKEAGITWRSSPASVAPFSRFAPAAQPHRTLRRARRLLCRAGNNKHQMRVTHSALGLHAGQPPDRSEGFDVVQPGLAPRNKAWKRRQPNEMASEQRVGNQLGGVKPEKALSMRTRKSVLLARGSTKGGRPIPWRQKRVEVCLSTASPINT